jgi:hypothetical protein
MKKVILIIAVVLAACGDVKPVEIKADSVKADSTQVDSLIVKK